MPVRLLALDVDGVLTDGTLYYTAAGEEMKAFHAQDGLGLNLLRKLGVELMVISGRQSAALERRLDDLGIHRRCLKCANKVRALQDACTELGIGLKDVAFMGDDLIDLPAMQVSGFAFAPANAVAEVKNAAVFVTRAEGGRGAVREVCDHIARMLGSTLLEAGKSEYKANMQ